MPSIPAHLVFTVLGPVFLGLAVWRFAQAKRVTPQVRAWALVGAVFSVVAAWLWRQG